MGSINTVYLEVFAQPAGDIGRNYGNGAIAGTDVKNFGVVLERLHEPFPDLTHLTLVINVKCIGA